MGANTLSVPVSLSKNMDVSKLKEALSKVLPGQRELQIGSVNTMPIYEKRQNRKRLFAQHQRVTKKNKENIRQTGVIS